MQNAKPLIVISNDDGLYAKGITQLIEIVRPLGDVLVVAPDTARSGYAMAMTSNVPVTKRLVRKEEGLELYTCSGTPVDCIKIALHDLGSRLPNLVLSGINHGENAGVNVHYSGTMGVVLEGCMKLIPSIGFSLYSHDPEGDSMPYASFIRHICQRVLEQGLPIGTCLNVNFPENGEMKGVKICRQARGQWKNEWEKTTRQNGQVHYWLTGYYEPDDSNDKTTDKWALANGFVAITPTTIDLTSYSTMQFVEQLVTL